MKCLQYIKIQVFFSKVTSFFSCKIRYYCFMRSLLDNRFFFQWFDCIHSITTLMSYVVLIFPSPGLECQISCFDHFSVVERLLIVHTYLHISQLEPLGHYQTNVVLLQYLLHTFLKKVSNNVWFVSKINKTCSSLACVVPVGDVASRPLVSHGWDNNNE